VYSFDRNFKSTLRNKSWLQRLRPVWQKAQSVGAYLVRVAFGSALIVSVLVVWLAIVALTSGRDNDRWVPSGTTRERTGNAAVRVEQLITPTPKRTTQARPRRRLWRRLRRRLRRRLLPQPL
jgi:hypothetical protein